MELIEKSSSERPAVSERLFRLLRSVYFLLRRALSKRKLLLVELKLHLLLERGRTAGRTIGRALSHGGCADHAMSFYSPRDVVEFSCSNTPTSNSNSARRRRTHRQYYYSAKVVERAFEILDCEDNDEADEGGSGSATPSPLSPPPPPPLSPPPPPPPQALAGRLVDKEAEEFIRRFYEQLRSQQQRMVAPESGFGR